MGQDSNSGHSRRGGSSDRSGRGSGGHGRTTPVTVPRKASEVGACKDLEEHIFTISSGNKGKDGYMLQTSVEKIATNIGTKYGDDAVQEWISRTQTVLPEPLHLQFILARHVERVKATRDWLSLKLTNLRDERGDIGVEMTANPTDRGLKKELRKINDDTAKKEIKLKDEVKMKLTDNEKTAHSNERRTCREMINHLKTSRGKVYLLLLGQCTRVLINKMKQDNDWVTISTSFNPSLLLKLIEKFVLKQSNNQYSTAVLISKQLIILQFSQEDQVSNAMYYNQFTTRVEVACQAGVCYQTPDLLQDKSVQLKMGDYVSLSAPDKKSIIDVVEQEYLAYLFINNSNAKLHSQLKKDIVNDYSKGNPEAYPNDIHMALTLMNKYQPLKVESSDIPSQGTAFFTDGKGGKSKGAGKCLPDNEWNEPSAEAQAKIIKACKKGGSEKSEEDDKSVLSSKLAKSTKSLSKTIKALEKENKKLTKSAALQQHEEEDGELYTSSISTVEEESSHFQDTLEMREATHPKIVLALKHESIQRLLELDLQNVLLLDNQSTFDLCCNKKSTSRFLKALHVLHMKSNGGGLKITKNARYQDTSSSYGSPRRLSQTSSVSKI
jgi:hypothetical protein